MNDEFQNALAWFRSAPIEWIDSGKKSVIAGAEWIWEVLQGDFNDDASTAQVAVGTAISMIPFVDQICDVRDMVACCRKIDEEPDNNWNWVSLALTLVGLIPGIGSLFKGCFKVAFASARKAGAVSGITPRLALKIDEALFALNRFIDRPEVVATLRALKWDNPYKILANKLREVAKKLNASLLMNAFNDSMKAVDSLLGLVQRWGSAALSAKAFALLTRMHGIQRSAYRKLEGALTQVGGSMQLLARRLDVEADMKHRVYLNSVNPHAFRKVNEAEELAAFEKSKPDWVDTKKTPSNLPRNSAPPSRDGWPSTDSFDTFHTMDAQTLPPGTVLYRIVDPFSKDNSICWMSKDEFALLKSKGEWRRRFAVWANWNANGEYITYTVPPGPGLNVWEGITASQTLKKSDYVLEGGGRQIVVDPSHLDSSRVSQRQKTGWGYDDLGTENTLIGVPVQRNNWDESGGKK